MRITDYKNEEALDLLADLIEPSAAIFADKEVAQAARAGKPKIDIAKIIIKGHKKEIIEIMARLDNVPVEKYECNVATIFTNLLDIINDKELASFFISLGQTEGNNAYGVVTANTTAKKK